MIIKHGTYSVSDFYTGDDCPNCGRNRLLTVTIHSTKSKTICEKCSWCVEDSEYAELKDEYDSSTYIFSE